MRLVVAHPIPLPPDTGGTGDCVDPDIHSFGNRVYHAMDAINIYDENNCWPFKKYVGALGEIFQEADDIARTNGVSWSMMVDIDQIFDYGLLWLAQFVGVRVPPRLTYDEMRAYIKSTPNWKRGTPAAIEGAAKLHLTGTKSVYMVERYNGTGVTDPAYTLQVSTLTSETPDPDLTLQDILTQKPAGIILNYRTVLGQTYQHLYETQPDYQAVYDVYASYNGVFDDAPGE